MKFGRYLKDKLYALLLSLISIGIILLIFFAFKIDNGVIIATTFVLIIWSLSLLLIDYLRKKKFYTELISNIEALDKGYLVIYKTSDELIKDLRSIALENNSTLLDLLINCDLLIIDDLGAEQVTDFATNELFNLINKKLLNNKKMLISTNLSLLEISNIYTTRLYSRLLGNFKLFKFYGDDVRIKLNISKKRP